MGGSWSGTGGLEPVTWGWWRDEHSGSLDVDAHMLVQVDTLCANPVEDSNGMLASFNHTLRLVYRGAISEKVFYVTSQVITVHELPGR